MKLTVPVTVIIVDFAGSIVRSVFGERICLNKFGGGHENRNGYGIIAESARAYHDTSLGIIGG